MKDSLSAILLFLIFASANSLGSTPPCRVRRRTSPTILAMGGWFDFKPIHGSGSGHGENSLDEQWEAQQEILKARRDHLTKNHLKNKYKSGGSGVFDVKPSIDVNTQQDNAMYVDEQKGFKMPWDK